MLVDYVAAMLLYLATPGNTAWEQVLVSREVRCVLCSWRMSMLASKQLDGMVLQFHTDVGALSNGAFLRTTGGAPDSPLSSRSSSLPSESKAALPKGRSSACRIHEHLSFGASGSAEPPAPSLLPAPVAPWQTLWTSQGHGLGVWASLFSCRAMMACQAIRGAPVPAWTRGMPQPQWPTLPPADLRGDALNIDEMACIQCRGDQGDRAALIQARQRARHQEVNVDIDYIRGLRSALADLQLPNVIMSYMPVLLQRDNQDGICSRNAWKAAHVMSGSAPCFFLPAAW